MKKRISINGDPWIVKIVTPKQMAKEMDGREDVAGLCMPESKTILIDEDSVTYAVVAHELYHSYFSCLHLGDTNNLTLSDIEEIAASMFTEKGEIIIKKAKKLTKDLEKLLKEGTDE